MQEEAAEKLDELLTPLDVSEAMRKMKENQAAYAFWAPEEGRSA